MGNRVIAVILVFGICRRAPGADAGLIVIIVRENTIRVTMSRITVVVVIFTCGVIIVTACAVSFPACADAVNGRKIVIKRTK